MLNLNWMIVLVVTGFLLAMGVIVIAWRRLNQKPVEAQDWKRNRAETLWKDAVDLQSRGSFAKALEKWNQSAFMESDSSKPRPGFLGQVHNELGYCCFRLGRFKESEENFTRALSFFRKNSVWATFDIAFTLNNYALLCLETGRQDRAMKMIRRSMKIFSSGLGERAPQMVHVLNNLARAHLRTGAYGKALEVLGRARDIALHSLLPNYPETLLAKELLAETHQQLGNLDEAERLLQEVVASTRALHGPDHPGVLPALNALGRFYLRKGFHEKSEGLHECMLGIVRDHFGPGHLFVGEFLNQFSCLKMKIDRISAAREMVEEGRSILERVDKPAHPAFLINIYLRMWLAVHDDDWQQGIKLLRQGMILLQIRELSWMQTSFSHLALRLLVRMGKLDGAVFLGKLGVRVMLEEKENAGHGHGAPGWLLPPSEYPLWIDLGRILRGQGRLFEAQALGAWLPRDRKVISSLHGKILEYLKTGWQKTEQEQVWEDAVAEWRRQVAQVFYPEVTAEEGKKAQPVQPAQRLKDEGVMRPVEEHLDRVVGLLIN
ncbi:MAG: tetratricopeptide repeat protein [Magnetococcales bacterium]|nr:tetratricopeptide repeat protein [Magnetococcales bacterium]